MGDNFSPGLLEKLASLKADILIQDELNHPSLFWMNDRLRKRRGPGNRYPIISIAHHLRSSERRPAWQNAIARKVERYLHSGTDSFNSQATAGRSKAWLARAWVIRPVSSLTLQGTG
jgi:hypothetical protein